MKDHSGKTLRVGCYVLYGDMRKKTNLTLHKVLGVPKSIDKNVLLECHSKAIYRQPFHASPYNMIMIEDDEALVMLLQE